MGQCIAKLADDEYVEWSTVVDAPIGFIHNRDEALKRWDVDRILRADEKGTSFIDPPETLEQLLVANRAGPNEEPLTLDEIREMWRDEQSYVRHGGQMVAASDE